MLRLAAGHCGRRRRDDGPEDRTKSEREADQQAARQIEPRREADLPKTFLLSLSKNGEVVRRCNIVWQRSTVVGVKFDGGVYELRLSGSAPAILEGAGPPQLRVSSHGLD
jgi:hypothetical protein